MLAVCGDGGFLMNAQELETAVRLRLDLVVLILEDNAYGMIRWKQATDGFADFGMTFGNPDFPAYAKAYGAKGQPRDYWRWAGARPGKGLSRGWRATGRGADRLQREHPGSDRRIARCRA